MSVSNQVSVKMTQGVYNVTDKIPPLNLLNYSISWKWKNDNSYQPGQSKHV